MRFSTCLFTAALILAASTVPAHADTYEFIVSNFDGYGSSATFDLPSTGYKVRNQYPPDNQLATGSVINFTFEPGASIPTYFPDIFSVAPISTVHYEQMFLGIGLDDHGPYVLDVGIGVGFGDFHIYGGEPLFVGYGDGPALFTVDDGIATFKLGTFPLDIDLGSEGKVAASVSIVNATPEPSTFVLLGTGILGLAGVARRKFLSI